MAVPKVSATDDLDLFKFNSLPKDIDKAVSKVRRFVTGVFYDIYAFFIILIYDPRNTWQGFWTNIKKISEENTVETIRNIYEQYKSSKPQKPENEVSGYRLSSEEDANKLKQKQDKHLDQYQLFEFSLTSEESKLLDPFLEQMANENTNAQISNILVSLNNLLNNPNVPIQIKNLLKEKLKKIPEAAKLIEALEPKISKPQDPPVITEPPIVVAPPSDPPVGEPPIVIQPPPPPDVPIKVPGSKDDKDEPQISNTYSLKKIAIVSAAVLTTFGLYYYFNSTESENADIVEEEISNGAAHSLSQAPESLFSNITNLFCNVTKNTFSNIKLELPWNKGVDAFRFQENIDTKNIPSEIWNFLFSTADAQTQDVTFIPSIFT
ncbi:MAG: hypothetical protein KR126chlam6_00288 [Candidatus Anoxychlamydiales bacterium]|nr:hypothetical protein [Candidatus Anoxychlamydiales bacterium]